MHHYNRPSFAEALRAVGIKKGDIVFSHSHIGFFGIPEGEKSEANAFRTILDAFIDVIGEEGTLIVPTFTYSFPQKKVFDPAESPSDCGIFTEKLRRLPEAYRSLDPCVSVAAIGRYAKNLTEGVPENAYGENSFFDRFYKAGGVICNMNFDAGSTLIHYAERILNVPYRFDKTFDGIIRENGVERAARSTIWVRQLVPGTEAKMEPFSALAKERGLFNVAKIGRGAVGMITAADTVSLVAETLPQRPWFLTEAEGMAIIPDIKVRV